MGVSRSTLRRQTRKLEDGGAEFARCTSAEDIPAYLAALASLVYVCSRPQTPEVRAAERHAVLMCWQRSADAGRTAISRDALATACLEMERQYLRKFGAMP